VNTLTTSILHLSRKLLIFPDAVLPDAVIADLLSTVITGSLKTVVRDRPKFGFGFGAEDNNLNCFGKFRFRPNIDL